MILYLQKAVLQVKKSRLVNAAHMLGCYIVLYCRCQNEAGYCIARDLRVDLHKQSAKCIRYSLALWLEEE